MAGENQTVPSNDPTLTPEQRIADGAAAEGQAQESVDELKGRIRDLEGRLTKDGRSRTQIESDRNRMKEQLSQFEQELASARAQNERLTKVYMDRVATPEEKENFVNFRRQQQETDAQTARREAEHYRLMATEDDPAVKQAMVTYASKRKYLDADTVEALREAIKAVPSRAQQEPGDETPPAISGTRTTGSPQKTVAERKAQVIADLKAHKPGVSVGDLMQLIQEEAANLVR